MSDNPAYTVIVPARDEEDSIARSLRSFGHDFCGPKRQVLVVCNASTDRTAERAAAIDPRIEVVELAEGGKWRAINEGLALRTHSTVLIVDADVVICGAALDALALQLEEA